MSTSHEQDVAALRAFNRVYTRRLGLLETHLDKSSFTLSEARILYEIVNRTDPTAAAIARALDLDRAQVSRTLKRFVGRGLVQTRDDPSHGRHQLLSLTPDGRMVYDALEASTRKAVGALLDELPVVRRRRLLSAAAAITDLFEADAAPQVTLRDLQIGDMGLIIHRQAILYAEEHGYDQRYEALIARIFADFHQAFDPGRDAAWIADMDGRMVGSVFLVHTDKPDVGKLRLLYVEPEARGAGVGKRLVASCIEHARDVGYARLELWTDRVLAAARGIYERAGFKLIEEAPDHFFGTESVSQIWSLNL